MIRRSKTPGGHQSLLERSWQNFNSINSEMIKREERSRIMVSLVKRGENYLIIHLQVNDSPKLSCSK